MWVFAKTDRQEHQNEEYRRGISATWTGSESHRSPTSGYAWEIQALFYGIDMARALKGILEELTLCIRGRNTNVCKKR